MKSTDPQFRKTWFTRVDEILHYVWDPIGIGGSPYARDEFQAYVPKVAGLLLERKSKEEIYGYLHWLESEHMGCPVTKESEAHTREVIDILWDHFEWSEKEPIQPSEPTRYARGSH